MSDLFIKVKDIYKLPPDSDGSFIDYRGFKAHLKAGKLHNEFGPAMDNGLCKMYYINNLLHRIDGPAVEYDEINSYLNEWWLNGKSIDFGTSFTNESWKRYVKLNLFS